MKKIAIQKSIEGGKYKTVILDEKLVNALSDFNRANEVFTFLLVKGLLIQDDPTCNNIFEIIKQSESVFKEYGLDKYDVRAHYRFDSSKVVDDVVRIV